MSNIKFPLEFKPGLGYSHNSGPPVGGWEMTPGSGFYGQSLNSILPAPTVPRPNYGFGSKKRRRKSKRKSVKKSRRKLRRKFGFPLMNIPQGILDMKSFPKYPVGPGNTSGGTGGVFLQGMPNFQSYWGFGRKRRTSKKRRSHKRRTSKKRRSHKRRTSKKRRSHKRRTSERECPYCRNGIGSKCYGKKYPCENA
jgi:hypothetical protein